MRTNSRQGPITDVIVGIVGAFVGGYFLTPLFHVSTINQSNFSLPALLVSLGGAIILLAIFRLLRNVGWLLLISPRCADHLLVFHLLATGIHIGILHHHPRIAIPALAQKR